MAHVSATMVVTPEGIPLVCDKTKPTPHYWKFPGGKSEEGETPEETAVREVEEEVGIRLVATDLRLISQELRHGHTHYFFCASVPQLTFIKRQGDEGERVGVYTPKEILQMNFFPPHLKLAEEELWELT